MGWLLSGTHMLASHKLWSEFSILAKGSKLGIQDSAYMPRTRSAALAQQEAGARKGSGLWAARPRVTPEYNPVAEQEQTEYR